MPQLLDYPYISGKRWEWHLVLFKEWLRHVEEGITHRRYVKWLRSRKVFDRSFVEYVELLLGIDHPKKKSPGFTEVGDELIDELKKSEQRFQAAHAKQEESAPESDGPIPVPHRRKRRRSLEELESDGPVATHKPPTAENDDFLKAILERFTELNPYLCFFTFKEIGDDFSAATELYRRIGTADFDGQRPSMPQYTGFLQWLEWLGGLQKVGFRHKATSVGTELGAYLKELPLDELIEPEDEEDEEEAKAKSEAKSEAEEEEGEEKEEKEGTAETAEEDAESAETDDTSEDDDDDEDADEDDEYAAGAGDGFDDDEELEGLDLPPEVEIDPDAEQYWKKEPKDEPAAPTLSALTEELKQLRSEPAKPEPKAPQPAPVAKATPPAQPKPDAKAKPKAKPKTPARAPVASPPAPQTTAPDNGRQPREALRTAVGWWLTGGSEAGSSGVSLVPHPSGKPLGVFKLLTLATLLEADVAPASALDLFRALEQDGVPEAIFLSGAPLDRALEVAWREQAAPVLEERLVHLLRYRRGLEKVDPDALKAKHARTLASTLRDEVTGPTLGPGLVFVVRELSAAGIGPTEGLDAVAWLPSLLNV